MKVALTIWNNRVAPVFDVTASAMIVDIQNESVASRATFDLSGQAAADKMATIAQMGAEVLICGAISNPAMAVAHECGIELNAFIAGDADEVLAAWIRGDLADPRYAMPGCQIESGQNRSECEGNKGFHHSG
jgi:predicted Fe-Mo cluster-binding NifX family protein